MRPTQNLFVLNSLNIVINLQTEYWRRESKAQKASIILPSISFHCIMVIVVVMFKRIKFNKFSTPIPQKEKLETVPIYIRM